AEYLDEIRHTVCSRCTERPPGGPPCAPFGKSCSIELSLPELIDSIHSLYQFTTPRHTLALIVRAVETVDERAGPEHKLQPRDVSDCEKVPADLVQQVERAFRNAVRQWTGCDWRTAFGRSRLDLNGWISARAAARAAEIACVDPAEAEDWCAAAAWLGQI